MAAHLLDHPAEDQKARVAVRPPRARLEVEWARRIPGNDGIPGLGARHLAIDIIERIVIAIPGQMAAEVLERDVLRAGEAREVFRDRVVDRELSLLLEHEQRAAGELLCDGADGEHRARRDGRARGDVRDAVAAREHDLAVLHDPDGHADDVLVGDVAANDAVDLVDVEARGLLRGGRLEAGNDREGGEKASVHDVCGVEVDSMRYSLDRSENDATLSSGARAMRT